MVLKKTKKHYSIILLGVFLLIVSFCLFIKYYSNKLDISNQEEIDIQKFFDENIEISNTKDLEQVFDEDEKKKEETVLGSDYIAVLEIPKIDLKKGLVDVDSIYNNVDYNIQIISSSTLPDVENGNFILAGHNGNSNVSFFGNLEKLDIDDKVYVYYDGIKYVYVIDKK